MSGGKMWLGEFASGDGGGLESERPIIELNGNGVADVRHWPFDYSARRAYRCDAITDMVSQFVA